ncbi:hypothetical protein KVH22_25380 [Streptomyces olivaceus]|uniref:hypothetical protein n=1 Tax=Streptomyces olivaceus TaxID=47716 RepID=UPI001CC9CECD|nr:hypothetical protein [Streptomyces olivaceus]MBZ6258851.1 hypothetical protein [Streptomyces olivaceus]
MPRTPVPVTAITRTGTAAPAETNGDTVNNHVISNNGRVVLLVRNASESTPRTITLRVRGLIDGQTVTPRTVTIPAEASRYIGPFPTDSYGGALEIDVDNAELKLSAFGI